MCSCEHSCFFNWFLLSASLSYLYLSLCILCLVYVILCWIVKLNFNGDKCRALNWSFPQWFATSWLVLCKQLAQDCTISLFLSVDSTQTLAGAVLMLKGSVLRFGFLDCMGALIQSPYEVWRDLNAPEDPDRPRRRKLVHFSPSSSQDACGEGHLAVLCSERQAKVFLMPSQSCLFVHNITESSFVLRADVVSVCNSVCLACFCANGHVMTLRYLNKLCMC